MKSPTIAAALGLLLLSEGALAARYTYHGELMDGDAPADGRYDFRLRALGAPHAKAGLAPATELPAVHVVDGRFSVEFDLPEASGADTWIEVAVRDEGGDYQLLGAPQPLAKANSTCPGAWALDGNTGVPAGSFLGLADPAVSTPLQLQVKGARVAEFTPAATNDYGNAPSVTFGSSGNIANAAGATVGGGGSTTQGPASPPCPTCRNAATANFATVSGGRSNEASGGSAVIGGGASNRASAPGATVAGGTGNDASGGFGATIGGGQNNDVSGLFATVAGGDGNQVTGDYAVVAGGDGNVASGARSTVAGGRDNIALGAGATVGGGTGNIALGANSFAMGQGACAGGLNSFAFGHQARTRYPMSPTASCQGFDIPTNDADGDAGSFVFADNQPSTFRSNGDNQFAIRASGGVGINTAPFAGGEIEFTLETEPDGNDYANLWIKQRSVDESGVLISVGDGTTNNAGFYVDHYDGSQQFRRMELLPSGVVNIRSNVTAGASGVTLAANGGSWSSLSDRRLKTAVEAIDARAILDRLMSLPISTWSYTAQGTGIRHLGPMAQDFAAAFRLGENDTTISTIDADGVALAAIQGLNQQLSAENAALRERLDAVEARLAALERGR